VTENEHVEADLRFLLHPYDQRDTPTPGFPSGRAFVAFAKELPTDAATDALLRILSDDEFPQQTMAAATLRILGWEVDGSSIQDVFCWKVQDHHLESVRQIIPEHQPRIAVDSELLTDVFFEDEFERSANAANEAFDRIRQGIAALVDQLGQAA